MTAVDDIYSRINVELEGLGKDSPYLADANEPDPRYLGFGVRAPEVKKLVNNYKSEIKSLDKEEKLALVTKLIDSGYGEMKTVALFILDQMIDYFDPEKFDLVDQFVRKLHGWSKVDSYTGSFLRELLVKHPEELMLLVRKWNAEDDLWLNRTSVVLFTRRIAKSGQFTDWAIEMCERLKFSEEMMVQNGVGWCLKDLMKHDKKGVLAYISTLKDQGVNKRTLTYSLRDLTSTERKNILEG